MTRSGCPDVKTVDDLLRFITLAVRIQMEDLISNASKLLAKFNHEYYTGGTCTDCGRRIDNKRYASLNVKHDILLARLKVVDDRKNR